MLIERRVTRMCNSIHWSALCLSLTSSIGSLSDFSSKVEQNVFLRSPRSHSNFASPDYFSSSRKYSLETDSNENSHHEHFNQKSSHEQQYSKSANDYDGRLQDSFFKYVKRSKDYDRNEVPWDGKKGLKPVEIQMSAYLRQVSMN